MALASGVHGGALRRDSISPSTDPLTQLTDNATLLFAWQLVGGAPSQDFLHSMCANFSGISGTWAAEGLNTALIRSVIDSADGAPPDPAAAASNATFYSSEIFTTQILNVAPGNTAFLKSMCSTMNAELLSSATLNATRVQTAVCDAAGFPVPSSIPAGGSPETEIQIAQDASNLYGWEAVGISNSTAFLSLYCKQFSTLGANLGKQGLYAAEIQQIFCNHASSPITPAEGKQQIIYYSTSIFIQILVSISEDEGYLGTLCSGLNTTAMNNIGLDGQRVSSSACGSSSSK
ncbi:hypothetical protein EV356DRAFT_505143 [Viridothelium virens]|uniref:Uncharacterized protein n=1 Tax=Viridothelium virens TaxID=1048519 RepID=A0A6A6H464_VIRVR|nr:hypothetical protein EV356DRAFT_505143 [Viridothelium virens]